MILLGCGIKKYIRRRWEQDRMHFATLEAIATININALRISADPDLDMDYIKGMSTLSIYDRNYRNPMQENISEVSMYIRPDVMRKLSNLDISDESEANYNANTPQRDIGYDVLQQISYLRIGDINEPDINERIRNIIVSENLNIR